LEIVRVDREAVLGEKIGEFEFVLDHAAAGVAHDFARRKRTADAQQARFLEDFAGGRENGTCVSRIGHVGHSFGIFRLVHASAGEDVVPGHEAERGVALGEQHLRLAIAPHEDASGRNSWFGRHRRLFLSFERLFDLLLSKDRRIDGGGVMVGVIVGGQRSL
jgi:hypothetical protein